MDRRSGRHQARPAPNAINVNDSGSVGVAILKASGFDPWS
jgi:hypothetical protein